MLQSSKGLSCFVCLIFCVIWCAIKGEYPWYLKMVWKHSFLFQLHISVTLNFFHQPKKKKIAPQIEYHSSLKNPADFIVRHQRTVHKSKTMPLFSPIFASENTFFKIKICRLIYNDLLLLSKHKWISSLFIVVKHMHNKIYHPSHF